jgi:hypothetical protein
MERHQIRPLRFVPNVWIASAATVVAGLLLSGCGGGGANDLGVSAAGGAASGNVGQVSQQVAEDSTGNTEADDNGGPVPSELPIVDIRGVVHGPPEALKAIAASKPAAFAGGELDDGGVISFGFDAAYDVTDADRAIPVPMVVAAYQVDEANKRSNAQLINEKFRGFDSSDGWPADAVAGTLDNRPHYVQASVIVGNYYLTFVASAPSAFSHVEKWARETTIALSE